MLDTRKELKEFLEYEKKLYSNRMGGGTRQAILRVLKAHPDYYSWKYVKSLRVAGYYYAKININPIYSVMYIIA